MTSNIIQFPKKNPRFEESKKLPTTEELSKIDPADHTVSAASELLGTAFVDNLIGLGYPVSAEYAKDICFVVEGIKSLMSKYYATPHPFHSLADLSFRPDDDGMLQFTNPRVKVAKGQANGSV